MTKKQITNIEVKKNNRNRIFRYIRKAGVVSNPDIAYHLQMSLPTVTQNTKEFLERGLLQEVGELASTGGRRAKALKVCADFRLAAGIDITGNHVSMLLVNLQGEILDCQRFAKPYEKGMAYYQELAQNLERFLDKNQVDRTRFLGLGISFPGIVNFEKKAITYSHVLGVEWLPLEDVSACFPYACFFLNDANAGAYAEGLQADRGEEFFYLSLSNTVGGAVFAHGELSQGKNFRCGEAGHMTLVPDGGLCYCGKKGCLDVYCSAKRLADTKEGNLEAFFSALKAGEEKSAALWEDYTDKLAVAVNNLHMILDCDIVLGGYVGSYLEPYLDAVWKKIYQRNTFGESMPFVRACRYQRGAAALGAGLRVIESFLETV